MLSSVPHGFYAETSTVSHFTQMMQQEFPSQKDTAWYFAQMTCCIIEELTAQRTSLHYRHIDTINSWIYGKSPYVHGCTTKCKCSKIQHQHSMPDLFLGDVRLERVQSFEILLTDYLRLRLYIYIIRHANYWDYSIVNSMSMHADSAFLNSILVRLI